MLKLRNCSRVLQTAHAVGFDSTYLRIPFSTSTSSVGQQRKTTLTSRVIVPQSMKRRLVRSIKLRTKLWQPRMKRPPYDHPCQVGDPVLRGKAAPVDPAILETEKFQNILDTMVTVMRKEGGIGISAPQIGIGYQIIALEYTKAHMSVYPKEIVKLREISQVPLTIFINPKMKILDYSKVSWPEGCQSIKGYTAFVERYQAVQIKGLNPEGKRVTCTAEGFPARIVQHEMDHLQGQLYIDIMDSKTFIDEDWMHWNLE
ncbi:peptide deformylase, mitochondrial-like [Glandiceps talaboti]